MSARKRSLKFLVLFIFILHSELGAQSGPAVVVALKGKSFTLTDKGQTFIYNTERIPTKGVVISRDNMIQTGIGDVVDIKLPKTDTQIKMAENTCLLFNYEKGNDKNSILTLVYGRLRIKAFTTTPIVISCETSLIEVNNGDVNVDYTVIPRNSENETLRVLAAQNTQKPMLQVSAFSGTAVVRSISGIPNEDRMTVKTGETLILDSFLHKATRIMIDQSLLEYWGLYEDLSQQLKEMQQYYNEQGINLDAFDFKQSTINLKTGGIIAGLVLVIGGVVMQSVIQYQGPKLTKNNQKTENMLYGIGYIPIGLGCFTLAASYFYKTPKQ